MEGILTDREPFDVFQRLSTTKGVQTSHKTAHTNNATMRKGTRTKRSRHDWHTRQGSASPTDVKGLVTLALKQHTSFPDGFCID